MFMLAGLAVVGTFVSSKFYQNPLPLDYAWGRHVEATAGAKGLTLVSLEEARQITETFSHIVLDARKPADYNAGRLPGALSLPLTQFDQFFSGVAPLLGGGQPVMVYCSGRECDESIKLGEILIKAGYTNISLFAGGMNDWTKAGYPVER